MVRGQPKDTSQGINRLGRRPLYLSVCLKGVVHASSQRQQHCGWAPLSEGPEEDVRVVAASPFIPFPPLVHTCLLPDQGTR